MQAQLPEVPSQPVDVITAEDLPEVPTEEPAGIYTCTFILTACKVVGRMIGLEVRWSPIMYMT